MEGGLDEDDVPKPTVEEHKVVVRDAGDEGEEGLSTGKEH